MVSTGTFNAACDAKSYTTGIALGWDNGIQGLRAGVVQVAKRSNTPSLDPKPLRPSYPAGGRPLLRLRQPPRRPEAARRPARRATPYCWAAPGTNLQGGTAGKLMPVVNGEQGLATDLGGFARLSWTTAGPSNDFMPRWIGGGRPGFIAGGRWLRYRQEMAMEAYYAWGMAPGTVLTADAQLIANPAHNAHRGTVLVLAPRLLLRG